VQVQEPRAPLADPWEPVNPHESAAPIKKRRKGRTAKAPSGNIVLTQTSTRSRRKANDQASATPVTSSIDDFVAKEMASKGKSLSAIKQVSLVCLKKLSTKLVYLTQVSVDTVVKQWNSTFFAF